MSEFAIETPRITYDINLGKYVDYINIDEDIVAARLRNEGLSEQQIAETSISVSAKLPPPDPFKIDTNGETTMVDYAEYEPTTRTVTLWPLSSIQKYNVYHRHENTIHHFRSLLPYEAQQNASDTQVYASYMSIDAEKILYHELRHRRQHLQGEFQVHGDYQKFVFNQRMQTLAKSAGTYATMVFGVPLAYYFGLAPRISHPVSGGEMLLVSSLSMVVGLRLAEIVLNRGVKNEFSLYEADPLEADAVEAEDEVEDDSFVTILPKETMILEPIRQADLHPAFRRLI